MHYIGQSLWGMHVFWWLFWIVAIVVLFSPITPVPRVRRRETPLEILQRRYAAGEIATAEYEERKAKLESDTKLTK
jgi:putative membrane protein